MHPATFTEKSQHHEDRALGHEVVGGLYQFKEASTSNNAAANCIWVSSSIVKKRGTCTNNDLVPFCSANRRE